MNTKLIRYIAIIIFCIISINIYSKICKINIINYFNNNPSSKYNFKIIEDKDIYKIQLLNVGLIKNYNIDKINGYIYINWEAGDGIYDIYSALYLTNKKITILAYSSFCPFYPTEIKFYKIYGNNYFDITDDIFPKIDPKLLFKKKYNFERINKIIKNELKTLDIFSLIRFKLKYILPRYGTTITVKLQKNTIFRSFHLKRIVLENKQLIDEFFRNINYDTFYFKWNKYSGKFVFSFNKE